MNRKSFAAAAKRLEEVRKMSDTERGIVDNIK